MSDNDRMMNLEIKLAFVEKLVGDLDDVIREMAGQLEALRGDMVTLRARVNDEGDQTASPTDIELPPHY
ncbi:MAG: putative coiled-coil protein SlyX [Myxococcota bacterium]|jgi:uncharacterized coiled-coil protein SlyX